MSMTDPIADMLTRIRNALSAGHKTVEVPGSKTKRNIAEILKREGFIDGYVVEDKMVGNSLAIQLRWTGEQPAILGIQRVSTPGQRRYARCRDIPQVRNGLGILIVSTPQGLMTDKSARKEGIGGELICSVW